MPRDVIYITHRITRPGYDNLYPYRKDFRKGNRYYPIPVHPGLENIALNYWQPVNQGRRRERRGVEGG